MQGAYAKVRRVFSDRILSGLQAAYEKKERRGQREEEGRRMTDSYIALDLETTGLEPKRDKIIEIGAVRVRRGKTEAFFQSLVNPGRPVGEHVCALTGIDNRMLGSAPEMGEALEPLLAFIGEDVLVGHRILFDYSFLKKEAVNRGIPFEKKGIDTLKLARKFLPGLESRKLGDLCRYYGIVHKAHRALGDAEAASALYLKLAEQFGDAEEEEGGKAFQPGPLVYRAKKETPITKRQKERLYKLVDKHRIAIECNVDRLTRNEADRIMNQILVKYGR